jgi:hypothetical protein
MLVTTAVAATHGVSVCLSAPGMRTVFEGVLVTSAVTAVHCFSPDSYSPSRITLSGFLPDPWQSLPITQ